MKILRYIFNILIWTVLALYLLFILTFQIPAVKEYLGRRMAGAMAAKLGTRVEIGSVDIGLFNHLTVNGLVIHDQQGKELLRANRLSARVDLMPLTNGKISISTAQLFGAHARLYQRTAHSAPNFQFVLDSLASRDTTSITPIDLRINSLIVRNSSVSYDRYDLPETPDKFNPKHLAITDISTHLVLKALTDDSLNLNVKRLSFKEKSGLDIQRISLKFEGGRHSSHLSDFLLRMAGTHIQAGDLMATYRLNGTELDVPSLTYTGCILPSSITLSDLSCFLPSLKSFNSTVSLSSSFKGHGERLDVPQLAITSTTDDIGINLAGWVNGLTRERPQWHVDINDLALSAKTVNFITENLQGEHVDVPPVVARLGDIHLKGDAGGYALNEIQTHGLLSSDAGSVNLDLSLTPDQHFGGTLETAGINMQQLLDDERFGNLSANIGLSGQLGDDYVVKADGRVLQFDYNGYPYQDIVVNGSYSSGNLQGTLTADDPNASFNIDGSIEQSGAANNVRLTALVDRLAPQAAHLSDQWGNAVFSGRLDIDFKASSLNDAVGTIDLSDLTMQSESVNYVLRQLRVVSGYDDQRHYMTLTSDFGMAELTGLFDYSTLAQSFTNFVAAKLPTLPGWPKQNPDTHNNFSISALINKSDWLQHLFLIPVELNQPLALQGTVNDASQQIALTCNAPYFHYRQAGYRNGYISISSPNDSLHYELKINKLMDDDASYDLHVKGNAVDNHLTTTLLWDNHDDERRMSGQINTTALFDTTPLGQEAAYISIEPSHLNVRDADWTVEPASITYTPKHMDVRNFTIRHGDQHLSIDGTASAHASDSLRVSLHDIDVEYVLDLVNFHSVDFNGYATGQGTLRSLFGTMEADAALTVRQFEFEHGRMGTLTANAVWNSADEQIDISATADDGADAMTYVDGYVSPSRNYIDLNIRADGTHLDFAHSFTRSFISHIEGHAQGAVNLIGPLDAINLTGLLVLNGSAHVSTLGCTYELRNDTLRCVPDEIMFAHFPIYDIHNHEAMLTGGIHHQDLTNLTYDIYATTDNLMAYDFPDFGDDSFYGTVYATGNAAIHGRQNEVVIEADITPQKNSTFVYNAAMPDAVTNQEFIEWNSHDQAPASGRKRLPADDFRSDLTMRLKINATPDATLRLLMDARTNDYITLRGNGDLQATYYNKGGFNMFGNYQVTNGTYDVTIQDIIRKNFTFKEGGTITFGGDPYDALLDLQAQYVVNGVSLSDLNVGRSFASTVRVNCLMNITGQPRAPIVDFDLDILNVNTDEKQMVLSIINGQEEMRQQVIYLLAVGRFYPQGANNAATEEAGQSKTSLAMQSLLSGTLSGQLNSVLGQVIKSNNWNFGANISTGDEGWNNAEYEGLVSGQLLNNRLLINGQFGYRDNATQANPSFIGDFDIRYLLLPNGNLALKVYNQTNDRYFTRSSLNTQGIGFIMKKDFSGWRDLFSRERKKKEKAK